MKRLTFVVFVFCFLNTKLFSQVDSSESNLFNNDSIRYDIIFISPSVHTLNQRPNTGRYVKLGIKKSTKDNLLKRDSVFWIDHLNCEKTDWATNLVLYCIYKREATLLSFIYNNRNKWQEIKKDEIEYWKSFLSSANKKIKE